VEENLPAFRLVVDEFDWDERNERHLAERGRLDPTRVEDVKDNTPKFYANKEGMAGSHMMIGPDAGGQHWTIIVLDKGHGRWRPITGWKSDKKEIELYNSA
jgi:uncharacterized DUF497 family protein